MAFDFKHLEKNEINFLNRIIRSEDIIKNLPEYRKAISFYRAYPDRLVDLFVQASGEECTFQLLDYQRIVLRTLARHKEVFLTFSRGTSKSFLNLLWEILACILYPNMRFGIVATTLGQSGAIVEAKMSELRALIPALEFEIKRTEKIKDKYTCFFKGGGSLQNVAAKASTRGLRFTGLGVEEIIEADPDMLQEVVFPTLAIQRRAANGLFNPDEIISQQKVSITTAGVKGTFAYHTLIRCLLRQLTEPDKAMVLGGSYKIPIIAGLQNMDFIRAAKNSGTFNPTSFGREYLSRWATGSENAYFPAETFDRYRAIQEPIFERETNLGPNVDYVLSIDVGRLGDLTEVAVLKYIPQKGTTSTKHLVNLYTFERLHFEEQAIEIKLLYEKYKPKMAIIDGAGLGVGLIDELIKSHVDVRTGQYLRPWGIANDEKGDYVRFKTADMLSNFLHIIKATAPFNTDMYANLQTQLTTGKLRFLMDERRAKAKIDTSRAKRFKDMTSDERLDWLVPFTLTSILRDQLVNLEEKREGVNIILDRTNKNIKKDKVSALGYGLWLIKKEIDDKMLWNNNLNIYLSVQVSGGKSIRRKKSKNDLTFNRRR